MSVRAKFVVATITREQWGTYDADTGKNGTREVQKVMLRPVSGGSEENRAFYAATPGGHIELAVVNPTLGFDLGMEFYVDFTPAAAPADPAGG